ncbi:transcriptional regulator [Streptacidiphilus pinicola]|uniref:Transcriptional regulator n=1 Tax=Streptacidiphilus pinicola TaxID=2219663 RepID=A0A2X0IP41_9ACTN|nr:helix-turn-helix transcriptional regulator [Streptacidiphilus pinicola]RAG86992.1 transcriptional regulator [Streptacidiphilus pinicola]
MARNPNLNELGEFLKERRAEINPGDLGLPANKQPRRVRGLRREEVAHLAAVSTDYYTRLEQGRVHPSGRVLGALAGVLRLSEDQRAHLFRLAGTDALRRPHRRPRQKARPELLRLLDDLGTTPALVLGRRTDILAWNTQAAALLTDFGEIPVKHRNYVRLLFTDPAMRTLYQDWENIARTAVAQLRTEAARTPADPRLNTLVGELSTRDEHFRIWWAGHVVAGLCVRAKQLNHPVVGPLTLDWTTLISATDPDQHLVTWSAEPGSPADDALRLLASWSATSPGPPPSQADTAA